MVPVANRGAMNSLLLLLADTSEERAHCFQGAEKTKPGLS